MLVFMDEHGTCELKLYGRYCELSFDRRKVYSFQNLIGLFTSHEQLTITGTPLTSIIESPKTVRRGELLAWVKSRVAAASTIPAPVLSVSQDPVADVDNKTSSTA
jgi:hypothetical protein